MAMEFISATAVAAYLGVSAGSVHNWCVNPPEGFAEPDAITRGIDGKIVGRSWFPEKLPEMRIWMEGRLKLTNQVDKDAHWALVNEGLKSSRERKRRKTLGISDNQTAIGLEEFPGGKK
jgi:hypothetical protein